MPAHTIGRGTMVWCRADPSAWRPTRRFVRHRREGDVSVQWCV